MLKQIEDLNEEIANQDDTISTLQDKIKEAKESNNNSKNEIRSLVRKNTMHESKINQLHGTMN